MEQMIRWTGVLAFVVIGISVWLGIGFPVEPKKLPKGFRSPILALELATSPADVRGIVGDVGDPRRVTMRASLKADFFFIGAYWVLFVAMAVLLARRDFSWAKWLAVAAGCCATAAAGFDILENFYIFRLLDTTLAKMTQGILDSMSRATLIKWTLVFGTTALLAPMFLWRQDWIVWIGYLYVLTFVIGLIGLLVYRPAIEWATSYPMGLGLITLAFLFTFWPRKFLQGL